MSGFARFIVVRMNRDHHYEDMESIQGELSPYMQMLVPPKASSGNEKIPFLTISEKTLAFAIPYIAGIQK